MTDDAVRRHLSGGDDAGRDFAMGVYPLLRDETCFFLAIDLDNARESVDAQAFLDACRRDNLPPAFGGRSTKLSHAGPTTLDGKRCANRRWL
ncbi:MAG: hypothetical protein AB7U20_15100 [Planctomycetaceae bacterium]